MSERRTHAGSAREVVVGNVYDKYGTRNPIARALMSGFLRVVRRFYEESAGNSVLEVGCGEGHLLDELTTTRAPALAVGTDLSVALMREARDRYPRQVSFLAADVYNLPFADQSFDLVLACEVLEHLDQPERALREIARVSRRDVIVTVPREPLWRALNLVRLRYVRDLGNTPGHVRHFSRRGICRLLASRFDIVDVASPLPWTAVRARVRTMRGESTIRP